MNYTNYDVYIQPFLRDSDVVLPALAGWFFIQYATQFVMGLVSSEFARLDIKEQRNFAIRMCAVVNGLVMFKSAFFFLSELYRSGWSLHSDHYTEIPGYRPYRLIIVAYFLWDCIVCVLYRWNWQWKAHAVCSFFGTYFLAFPFSEQYATYFSGMFETSNAFIHTATMLRTLNTFVAVATFLEYVFAALFLFVRVVGGTYITYKWYAEMIPLMIDRKTHANTPIILCLSMIWPVLLLQYYWFYEIIAIGLGWKKRDVEEKSTLSETKEDAVVVNKKEQ